MAGFTVGFDENHCSVDIRVRWKEDATPEDVVSALAKTCGSACEELTKRLGEVTVD